MEGGSAAVIAYLGADRDDCEDDETASLFLELGETQKRLRDFDSTSDMCPRRSGARATRPGCQPVPDRRGDQHSHDGGVAHRGPRRR